MNTVSNRHEDVHAMHLRIFTPNEILLDETVIKIIAEADDGAFCLLPRHIDFVTALVPCVLYYYPDSDKEMFVAVDEGILIKRAQDVYVSTFSATRSADLEQLETHIREQFLELDEHERKARTALARLEAGTLRGFKELQDIIHG